MGAREGPLATVMGAKETIVRRWEANWPYLLVLIPILAAWICDRSLPSNLRSTVTNIVSGLLTLVLVMTIQYQRRRMTGVSITDRLTGVFNSRYLRIELDRQVFLAHRIKSPLSLIFLDVDNLKAVNDRHGHMAGNLILRRLGQSLIAKIRQHMDLCFRFGGDEFLVLCPHADLGVANGVAERVLAIPAEVEEVGKLGVTLSLGLIELREGESPGDFLKRADRVMYSVKQSGKNRIGFDAKAAPARLPLPVLA